MKTKMKYIFFYSLTTIFSLYLISCSELNTDIPSVPKVNTHGDSIYVPTSANYHPKTIADSPDGMYDCQQCHAADFSGGVAGVGCNTADCHPTIGVHFNGIVDPTSENFHGNYIRKSQWNMIPCQSCHGNNYDGGNYKYADGSSLSPTCLDCHKNYGGPENCATCHGSATSMAPPRDLNGNTSTSSRGVGAHQVHLAGSQKGKTLSCTDCHNVPGDVYQTSGHIDADNRAEVLIYSEIAKVTTNDDSSQFNFFDIDPNQITYIPNPVYNPADLTCSNTYCHGYFKNGNIENKPIWNDPTTSECGSCHGNGSSPLPKTFTQGGNHPNATNCSVCHGGVVDANLKIINPSKHIDGLLNLAGKDVKY